MDHTHPAPAPARVPERVAPAIPVLDVDAALDRYQRLGFSIESYESGARYGFVERDYVSLHITDWSEHEPKRTGADVYLYVSDADAVHAEWARS